VNAGRKPIDPVFMFRVLFLQRLYGLSDAQIEYHIKNRTSFRDFLGIQSVNDVPDEKTVCKYKDNVEICNKTKLTRNYTLCAASRHDSKETEQVLTEPPIIAALIRPQV